jgi:Domain of unknown function (DUF1902)
LCSQQRRWRLAIITSEAQVWVAQSDDIGLATEADSIDILRNRIPDMIADVVEDDAFELDFGIDG